MMLMNFVPPSGLFDVHFGGEIHLDNILWRDDFWLWYHFHVSNVDHADHDERKLSNFPDEEERERERDYNSIWVFLKYIRYSKRENF